MMAPFPPEPETETSTTAAPLRVRGALALTWLAIVLEHLGRRLWLPLTGLGLFVALALTDILPSLPTLMHAFVVLGAAGGIGYATWRALRGFTWPSRDDLRTRLEAQSDVVHRPLTTVEDTLAPGASPAQAALWKLHQNKARDALDKLRAAAPGAVVAKRDPFALRAAVILGLVVGLFGAGGDLGNRLGRALMPTFGGSASDVSVKLWVTPPEYTHLSPLYLESPAIDGAATGPLFVPADSKVLAVVTGTSRDASLVLDGKSYSMEKLADDSQRIEMALTPVKRIEVRRTFGALAGWDVNWTPDAPPSIAFSAEPKEAARWRLRIDYKADDDYGLASIAARITRANDAAGPPAEVLDVPLVMPPFNPKSVAHAALADLTAHPWSGLDVNIQLIATDQAGQTAFSESITAVLPERAFSHPVAKELALQRKALMVDATSAAATAYDRINRILRHPETFGGDPIVHLALSAAKYRLAYMTPNDAATDLQSLLWQTAVRVEDGNLTAAEKKLDQAEQALTDAMERDASPQEISALIDQLQRALAEYTQAMAEQMQQTPQEMQELTEGMQQISPNEIASMMEQIRQLSAMGAEDAAKQMLAELQQMLQAMRNAAANPQQSAEAQEAENMLQELRELSEAQSKMQAESFEKAREDALRGKRDRSSEAREAAKDAAREQQKLQEKLEQLMERMAQMTGESGQNKGETPEELRQAADAMSQAAEALGKGAWKAGSDSQGEALAKMEAGLKGAAQQMRQALMQKGMTGFMPMPGQGQRRFDPMGRRAGPEDGQSVEIPRGPDAQGTAQRVRAILEEIRKRASDRTRPAEEQDYLRRLMQPY